MKKEFSSSNGKGNGVNTNNRCMGCIGNCETCPFKDAPEKPTFEDFLEGSEWERLMAWFEEQNKRKEAGELGKKEDNAPILCKPYIVTIGAIYHQYFSGTEIIVFRLDVDKMGKVIKEPWSPHGTNSDNRLDSLVFGYSLHHLTPNSDGRLVVVDHALELVQSIDEGDIPNAMDIIYPVGPSFMAKTIKIDCAAAAATVRQIENSRKKNKWIMAVYEIMQRNLVNDTEYLIGLPTSDIQPRKV